MSWLSNPTPRQFYYLVIGYILIAGLLSYFLAGGMMTFMASFGGIYLLTFGYVIRHGEVKNKQHFKAKWWICFAMPLHIIFYLIFYGGILFKQELIEDRTQLSQIVGTVPATSTYESFGSGKYRKSYTFLVVNDVNLNCGEDNHDSCDDIYQHQEQTATIYYQANGKNDNLVYEIIINNQPVYDFDSQLQKFKNERRKEHVQILWAMLLYLLPAFYWLFLYKKVLANVIETEPPELISLQKKPLIPAILANKNKNANPTKSITDYLWLGIFLIPLFMIAFIVGFFSFLMGLTDEHGVDVWQCIIGLITMVVTYQLMRFFGNNRQ